MYAKKMYMFSDASVRVREETYCNVSLSSLSILLFHATLPVADPLSRRASCCAGCPTAALAVHCDSFT